VRAFIAKSQVLMMRLCATFTVRTRHYPSVAAHHNASSVSDFAAVSFRV
jgi:hypothetical protein